MVSMTTCGLFADVAAASIESKRRLMDTFFDDNTVYHHIDVVLFIFSSSGNFGHIIDNPIDTDTDVTVLLESFQSAFMLPFSRTGAKICRFGALAPFKTVYNLRSTDEALIHVH